MASTRHFIINVNLPVYRPNYRGLGMAEIVVTTGTSGTFARSYISGSSPTNSCFLAPVASGLNEFTLTVTGASSQTIYMCACLIRPDQEYMTQSADSAVTTLSYSTSPTINRVCIPNGIMRRYIPEGYLKNLDEFALIPYYFRNNWNPSRIPDCLQYGASLQLCGGGLRF